MRNRARHLYQALCHVGMTAAAAIRLLSSIPMFPFASSLVSLLLITQPVLAQSSSDTQVSSSSELSSAVSTASVSISTPTGPQTIVYDYGSILETSILGAFPTNTSAYSSSQSSTSTGNLFGITGASSPSPSSNATASSSARPQPTNTRPCNGYVEFCDRRLSNVSLVVAHNSPFVVPHNAASNQVYPVLNQLADGIRGCKFSAGFKAYTMLIRQHSAIRDALSECHRWPPSLPYIMRSARCRHARIIPKNC